MATIPEIAEKIKKPKSLFEMFTTPLPPEAPKTVVPIQVSEKPPSVSLTPIKPTKEIKKTVPIKKVSAKTTKPVAKTGEKKTPWAWITEPWKDDAKLLEKGAQTDFNYYLKQAEYWIGAYPALLMAKEEKAGKDLESIKKEKEKTTKELIEIKKQYAEKMIEMLDKYNQQLTDIYSELMKQIPKMEPDEKTQWARNLAMALMAISGFVHPGYSPYFYMAIPQIVEYWRNEDRENFEMAMEKFNAALNIAGIKMNYLTQITENNLKKLQSLEEIDILPVQMALEKLEKEEDTLREQILNYESLYLDFLGKLPETLARLADIKGRTDTKLLSEQLNAWWKQMQAEFQAQRNWIYYLSVITRGGRGERPLTPIQKARVLEDIDTKVDTVVKTIIGIMGGKDYRKGGKHEKDYNDDIKQAAYEIVKTGENIAIAYPELWNTYLNKIGKKLYEQWKDIEVTQKIMKDIINTTKTYIK
jgi:hypothetical protein